MQPENTFNHSESTRTRVLPKGLAASANEFDQLRAAVAGRFALEREIGAGGMGRVYLATDLALERRVALKTILPEILSDASWVARFRLEAAFAAGLQHPNLVQVYEILQVNGAPVLVMEYVEGDSLAKAVTDGCLGQGDLFRLMESVCDGIAHAHAHGVIHCDVKPGNILLTRHGVPKVGDFGLAVRRPLGHPAPVTDDPGGQSVVGSPAYMSPEQASGDPRQVSSLTDVYALGATLYYALVGRPPFGGSSVIQILERVRRGEVTPPRVIDPRIDRDLDAICLKAMHRDPASRYAGAREMGADLYRARLGLPVAARRYGLWESIGRAVRARKETFAIGLAVLLAMGLGLGGAVSSLYATAEGVVLGEIRRKVAALANTAAMIVDPALVQAVDGPESRTLPEAHQLAGLLHAIRSRSREDVRYVWVMRQRDPSSSRMEFVASSESFVAHSQIDEVDRNRDGRIDAEDLPALPGDPFDAAPFPELVKGFAGPTADLSPEISDQWGVVLSGYAPVVAADGRAIAVLGVDVAQKQLRSELADLDRARWVALSIAGALALLSCALMLLYLVGLWRRSGSNVPAPADKLPDGVPVTGSAAARSPPGRPGQRPSA